MLLVGVPVLYPGFTYSLCEGRSHLCPDVEYYSKSALHSFFRL